MRRKPYTTDLTDTEWVTSGIMDSQTVKQSNRGGECGFDGAKLVFTRFNRLFP